MGEVYSPELTPQGGSGGKGFKPEDLPGFDPWDRWVRRLEPISNSCFLNSTLEL